MMLFSFSFLLLCTVTVSTTVPTSSLSENFLDDLTKGLSIDDYQWVNENKITVENLVENACRISMLRKCYYKVRLFVGIIWDGYINEHDMIDIRQRTLQYMLECDLKHMLSISMRITIGNVSYNCDLISRCFIDLMGKTFETITTITADPSYDINMLKSFNNFSGSSQDSATINIACFFTNYPNDKWANNVLLKSFLETNNDDLVSVIKIRQIYTNVMHYANSEVIVRGLDHSGKLDNQTINKCREIGFSTRRNGSFCDEGNTQQTDLCKNPTRQYSIFGIALDKNQNLKENYEHTLNIINKILTNNCTVNSTDKYILLSMEKYSEKICTRGDTCAELWPWSSINLHDIAPQWANSDNLSELVNDVELYKSKMLFYLTLALIRGFYYGSHNLYMFTNKICSKSDELIQTIYHGIQKELFDGLRTLAQNLTIKANWVSLTNPEFLNSTCEPSIIIPEQKIFEFYHLPLNATDNEDFKTLLVCPKIEPALPRDQTTETPVHVIPINSSMDQKTIMDNWWIYVAMAAILFIVILLIIIFFRNYIKKLLKKISKNGIISSDRSSLIRMCEINAKFIQIYRTEKLGEGAFSSVFKGCLPMKKSIKRIIRYDDLKHIFNVSSGDEKQIDIAIKVFHKEATPEQKLVAMDPWREIRLIKRIRYHPYIVNMIGWARMPFDGPVLLLEFCANGNLLNFLQRLRPLIKNDALPTAPYENCLRIKDLILRAWEISDAMVYLTENNFVHRDLAARNILLTDKMIAKVADFGLCRCTADPPYIARGGIMPLKWMAIEALQMLGFSEKTDVWSYGVLLYEMFSVGIQPYSVIEMSRGHKFSQQNLLEFLQNGERLEKPKLCPENLYSLMENCWKENPEERVSFKEIRGCLLKMLDVQDEAYGYVQIQEDKSFHDEYVHIIT